MTPNADATRAYTTVVRPHGSTEALRDGTVRPRGLAFAFVDVDPIVAAFRRMVRGLEFDLCEMAAVTYLVARQHGVRFTALPIFLARGLHHGAIVVDAASAIRTPQELAGRRVGVARGYTVTGGVWARAILQTEYGVELDRVRWVLSGDEHVAGYRAPPNVEPMPAGATLGGLLRSGEIAAVIGGAIDGALDGAPVRPLIAAPLEAGLRALRERGSYPINHLIVARDDVLAANPAFAPAVFAAFTEAKRRYVERLRAAAGPPSAADAVYRRVLEITGDPLPYGVPANRRVLDTLIEHAVSQHILPGPVDVDSLFAAKGPDAV